MKKEQLKNEDLEQVTGGVFEVNSIQNITTGAPELELPNDDEDDENNNLRTAIWKDSKDKKKITSR